MMALRRKDVEALKKQRRLDGLGDAGQGPYAGFAPRALALFIDSVIWIPINIAFHSLFNGKTNSLALLSYLLLIVLSLAHPVIFHAQWGQTLGKMVSRIKVTRLDGKPIGYGKAALRSSVDILLMALYVSGVVSIYATWEGPEWSTLSYMELNAALRERNASVLYLTLSLIWTGSELVVLLLNEKKRALHDFIAGTVVIHKL